MKLKRRTKKAAIILMAAAALSSTVPVRTFATQKEMPSVEEQKADEKDSWEKKREKEYAKWKIKNVDGVYYYKQKAVYLLVDDTKKQSTTNHFYYNKKGKVNLEIIRNEKGKIKKIKKFSKKKAEEILDHLNTSYVFQKDSDKE